MRQLVNLTPHDINIERDGMPDLILKGSENPARVSTTQEFLGCIDGVDIVDTSFGKIENLPERTSGIFLIVSRIVLEAAGRRHDLLVPDNLIRDEKGIVVGCKNLST